MTAAAARLWRPLRRRLTVRRIRLTTGLIMFAYVTIHLTNHSLGNVSLEVMDATLDQVSKLWLNPIGAVVLYGALGIHLSLGLWALYERRHNNIKLAETIQLVLGLCIPALLIDHVTATRLAFQLYGTWRGFPQEIFFLWVYAPVFGLMQVTVLLVAWIHGCIGLYFWLRLKPIFPNIRAVLLAIAVLLPATALLGFAQAGREVSELSKQPQWRTDNVGPDSMGTPQQADAIAFDRNVFLALYFAAVALVLLARGVRVLVERHGGMVRMVRADGVTMEVPRGTSVLEAAWRYKQPHPSVCGGRGRCSTCRIWLMGDHERLPPASPAEAAVLATLNVGSAVRLACQLRPLEDIAFAIVLPPNPSVSKAYARNRQHAADERYIIAMFVDMRGSTRLAERRLPFDTVFIINRFHEAVGNAVVAAGGETNQLLGDGVLALFGLKTPAKEAARQAMHAAIGIAYNIAALNRVLQADLAEPIRFGIGIHSGTAIVGDIGYQSHMVFTAVGDPVNTAARLQDQTKALHCEVVLSDEVCDIAGLAPDALPRHEVFVAGREAPIRVRAATTTADLGAAMVTVVQQ